MHSPTHDPRMRKEIANNYTPAELCQRGTIALTEISEYTSYREFSLVAKMCTFRERQSVNTLTLMSRVDHDPPS